MDHAQLASLLKISGGFVSIKRITMEHYPSYPDKGCTLKMMDKVLKGETLCFSAKNTPCYGFPTGAGLSDGIPNTPGGFGYFIAQGRGQGFPPGERIKCCPDLGEEMLLRQPQDVMAGHNGIMVKPYAPEDEGDTVTALVNMDQLSTLIHLFNYRKTSYDNVYFPMVSGCASVFRLPFGELKQIGGESVQKSAAATETVQPQEGLFRQSRAVIGNADVFSRPHFPKETAFFTVSGNDFTQMLKDADESVLIAPIFKGVKARL